MSDARTAPVASPGRLEPGRRVYAIGDIHGCLEALGALHRLVAADLVARPVAEPTLVHLGDYIDRGPDSAGVLERLLTPSRLPPCPVVNLTGNHEALLAGALRGKTAYALSWLRNGGDATLASWGIDAREEEPEPERWDRLIPAPHRALLAGLQLSHAIDGYLFVHAGVRPDRPLSMSGADDLLWIREPFLSWTGRLERVVVHGHTPEAAPSVRPHRIGIDTGAVFGGRLTCAVLEGNSVSFLSVPGLSRD